jgi:hypothetical protein
MAALAALRVLDHATDRTMPQMPSWPVEPATQSSGPTVTAVDDPSGAAPEDPSGTALEAGDESSAMAAEAGDDPSGTAGKSGPAQSSAEVTAG